MAADASLDGLEELLDRIRRMGEQVSEVVEVKALRAGANVLKAALRSKAPRSQTPRKATAKNGWRTGKHAADNFKISGVKTVDGVKSVLIGVGKGDTTKYFYLKFAEYGTSKQSAKPFMAPAQEESKSAVFAAMKDTIKAELHL